jgi:hypothetical protein
MKFDVSGNVVTGMNGNTSVLRSSQCELRVAPVVDNKEMIKVTSADPQLPSGRYVLVTDYSVAGFILTNS